MTRTEALQAVLAGEHAAVYAFGVVGGRLRGVADEYDASAAYDRHRARRDRVTAELLAAGASPVGPQAALRAGRSGDHAVRRARPGRRRRAGAVRPVRGPGRGGGGHRTETAADWCSDAAVRSVGWGGDPVAFPGLAERS